MTAQIRISKIQQPLKIIEAKESKISLSVHLTSQNKGSDKIWRLFSRLFFVQIYKINSPESSFVFLLQNKA